MIKLSVRWLLNGDPGVVGHKMYDEKRLYEESLE